jgi:hypothetical protein
MISNFSRFSRGKAWGRLEVFLNAEDAECAEKKNIGAAQANVVLTSAQTSQLAEKGQELSSGAKAPLVARALRGG